MPFMIEHGSLLDIRSYNLTGQLEQGM